MKASSRSWIRTAAVLVLAASASSGVLAQAAEGGRGRDMAAQVKQRFEAADVNHDGRLTKEEAKTGMPNVYKNFDAIDTRKSGSVTLADIAAFVREKAAARKAGG